MALSRRRRRRPPLTNFVELLAIVVVPAGMPYAFGRATGRREAGSMAGLSANTPSYNVTLLISMMAGRFGLAILALALAGRLASQRTRAPSIGAVPSGGTLFVGIVLGTAVLVGALTYFPVLALGPIVEPWMAAK